MPHHAPWVPLPLSHLPVGRSRPFGLPGAQVRAEYVDANGQVIPPPCAETPPDTPFFLRITLESGPALKGYTHAPLPQDVINTIKEIQAAITDTATSMPNISERHHYHSIPADNHNWRGFNFIYKILGLGLEPEYLPPAPPHQEFRHFRCVIDIATPWITSPAQQAEDFQNLLITLKNRNILPSAVTVPDPAEAAPPPIENDAHFTNNYAPNGRRSTPAGIRR